MRQVFGPKDTATQGVRATDDQRVPSGNRVAVLQPDGRHDVGMRGSMERPDMQVGDDLCRNFRFYGQLPCGNRVRREPAY